MIYIEHAKTHWIKITQESHSFVYCKESKKTKEWSLMFLKTSNKLYNSNIFFNNCKEIKETFFIKKYVMLLNKGKEIIERFFLNRKEHIYTSSLSDSIHYLTDTHEISISFVNYKHHFELTFSKTKQHYDRKKVLKILDSQEYDKRIEVMLDKINKFIKRISV